MEKIRILLFIHSLTGGGAERQLGYLVKISDKSLFSYAVCCVDEQDPNHLSQHAEIISIPQQWYPFLPYKDNITPIVNWKPDIVHAWIPLVLPESMHLGKRTDRHRYLANYRNVYTLNHIRRLHQFYCLFKVGKIVSNVEPENLKQPFQYLYNLKSGVFIPNGFDISAIEQAQLVDVLEKDFFPSKWKILYVGRFAEHKNIRALLEASNLLKRTNDISFQIVLCGKGKQEYELRNWVIEQGIDDQVTFLGYRENVIQVMKSCDCLVHPSFNEGMPNVLFEAMLARIPVIASDIPVHRRWTQNGKNAILFDPHSPESLKGALLKVFRESDNERMLRTEAAYQYAAQFSIAAMVEKYEQLYQNIVDGG